MPIFESVYCWLGEVGNALYVGIGNLGSVAGDAIKMLANAIGL